MIILRLCKSIGAFLSVGIKCLSKSSITLLSELIGRPGRFNGLDESVFNSSLK